KSLFSERKPFRDFIGGFGPGKGKFHYFAASGFPLFGENGEFLGYRGVGRDISAIVMADERLGAIQARLDQSHELLSSVFSTLEAAIIVFDSDDRLHMANGAALAIYEGVDKAVFEPGTALTDFLGAVYDAPGLSDITGSRPPRDVWIAGRLEDYHQPVFHK